MFKRSKHLVLVLAFILVLTLVSGCWRPAPDPEPDPEPNDDPVVVEPELPGILMTIVENHPAARPQSGLELADVVYEMVSEGNITRFLACFYQHAPEKIGPVRSVRPAFSEIAKAYNSPLAHAGGSAAGLASVRNLKVQNLDEIYNASRYFWRANDRRMPHNLYTSADRILNGAQSKNYTLTPAPAKPVTGIRVGGTPNDFVEVTYSRSARSAYATQFAYDGERYYKKINGEAYLADTGDAIAADNVIVLVIRTTYVKADGNTYADIHLIGSGDAYFFIQGQMYEGKWHKANASSHFSYTVDGVNFLLADGQTWVQIVPAHSAVAYGYTPPDEEEESTQ